MRPEASRLQAPRLVLFGGERREDKLVRLRRRCRLLLEWTPLARVGDLLRRVRAGLVSGVVVLEGLVGHGQTAPLIRALRSHGVPFEYAGRGGLASIEAAVQRLHEAPCG